ncbi:MAG: hypothetical protein LBO77_07920 [Desulfovibrio sp.]|jgi:hypothetical protein|nr:hypothetical protein [Desulfovibrio sp.]
MLQRTRAFQAKNALKRTDGFPENVLTKFLPFAAQSDIRTLRMTVVLSGLAGAEIRFRLAA